MSTTALVKRASTAIARFLTGPRELPTEASVEVATVQKSELQGQLSLELPNPSEIIGTRARGQGLKYYRTMRGTDGDLAAFVSNLKDDVLHVTRLVIAASDSPEHQLHARFLEFALKQIPQSQNIYRNILDAYAVGFIVLERMYRIVERGEWAGAVVYDKLLDRPQHWFTFDPQQRLRLRTMQNQSPGELVNPEKFIVVTFGSVSNPYGAPILDETYWAWFIKHHLTEMLALYYEKWAMPTPMTKYPWTPNGETLNEKNRKEAVAIAMRFHRENAFAIPKGMEFQLLESTRQGSVSIERGIDLFTEVESRRVTGQVLTSMAITPGSYAMSRTHAKQESNKVDSLGDFLGAQVSRQIGRDLIDRNFGPQDAYPEVIWLTKSALERQAEAVVEQMQIANGHKISASVSAHRQQIVGPRGDGDELIPSPTQKASQALPVNPNLAAADWDWDEIEREFPEIVKFNGVRRSWVSFARPPTRVQTAAKVELAAHDRAGLYEDMAPHAEEARGRLKKIATEASTKAKPAIRRLVGRLATRAKEKKSVGKLTRGFLVKGLRGAGADMGRVFERMLDRSENTALAEGDGYDDLSDAAKIALALLAVRLLEHVFAAAQDAGDAMTPEDFAKSLTEDTPDSPTEIYSGLFQGEHITDIASVRTANLRRHLESPAFRVQFPYVMISSRTAVRPAHRLMDGFVMSAEDARWSPDLPPFDYGCGEHCIAIPIPAATARARGLTGANPTGTLDQYVRSKGGGDLLGTAPGFLPAYSGTDARAQLTLLREKVEAIRREDPEGWAALQQFLLALFGFDVLTRDPDLSNGEPEAA